MINIWEADQNFGDAYEGKKLIEISLPLYQTYAPTIV